MPKYPENLIHFCRPVLEHYELKDEMGRMFVRSMRTYSIGLYLGVYRSYERSNFRAGAAQG